MMNEESSDSDVGSVASDDGKKERINRVSIKRGGANAFMASVGTGASISGQMAGARVPAPGDIGRGKAPWAMGGRGSSQPPVTITGVAPWAMRGGGRGSSQPPVTITGVAPWAVQTKRPPRGPGVNMPRAKLMKGLGKARVQEAKVEELKEEEEEEKDTMDEEEVRPVSPTPTGYMLLKNFMESIKPEAKDKHSAWSKSQLAETPTLQPDLRFHGLVFGQILGTGAFSTVKYARRIVKNSSRSKWEEVRRHRV